MGLLLFFCALSMAAVTWTPYATMTSGEGECNSDAVEAHSCVDTSSEIPLMSNAQLLINQLQDVSVETSCS